MILAAVAVGHRDFTVSNHARINSLWGVSLQDCISAPAQRANPDRCQCCNYTPDFLTGLISGLTARQAFYTTTSQAGELDKAKKQWTEDWKYLTFLPALKFWCFWVLFIIFNYLYIYAFVIRDVNSLINHFIYYQWFEWLYNVTENYEQFYRSWKLIVKVLRAHNLWHTLISSDFFNCWRHSFSMQTGCETH